MSTANTLPSLLLVHGAWHGRWCWEEKFAPRLRELGHPVVSMDLPGHGQAGGQKIGWYAISDYVDAVEGQVASMSGPVAVLGHSMGGFVVQKLMQRRPANLCAAGLLASASVRGVWGISSQLMLRRPLDFLLANLSFDLYRFVRSPAMARALFYSEQLPEQETERYWAQLNNESFRAFLDMLGLARPRAGLVDQDLPKLVLGGAKDAVFPPAVIQRTAAAYGVSARIYPDMGHNLMLDAGWEQVAADVSDWLQSLALSPPAD